MSGKMFFLIPFCAFRSHLPSDGSTSRSRGGQREMVLVLFCRPASRRSAAPACASCSELGKHTHAIAHAKSDTWATDATFLRFSFLLDLTCHSRPYPKIGGTGPIWAQKWK